MKEFKIEVPNGYEIDESKSTFEKIVFKKQEIDFSILNDTDWFYVREDCEWYVKGNILERNIKNEYAYCIDTNITIKCKGTNLCNKSDIKELRKCTPEEIETIKSKFPELFEKEYPNSVLDIEGRGWYFTRDGAVKSISNSKDVDNVSTKERAEALLELSQLLELRDKYNEIDDCFIDFSNDNQKKYTIELYDNKLNKSYTYYKKELFAFGNESTRDLFFDRFKDKIEFVLKNL